MGERSEADRLIGIAVGALTFIAAWIYCMATYGFLFGFGLGWLPSGILAAMVGFAMMFLWQWLAVLAGIGAVYIALHR